MASKRTTRVGRARTSDSPKVTRAGFDSLIKLLNERGEIINEIRRELETQFTRIAQLQQELDAVKAKLRLTAEETPDAARS